MRNRRSGRTASPSRGLGPCAPRGGCCGIRGAFHGTRISRHDISVQPQQKSPRRETDRRTRRPSATDRRPRLLEECGSCCPLIAGRLGSPRAAFFFEPHARLVQDGGRPGGGKEAVNEDPAAVIPSSMSTSPGGGFLAARRADRRASRGNPPRGRRHLAAEGDGLALDAQADGATLAQRCRFSSSQPRTRQLAGRRYPALALISRSGLGPERPGLRQATPGWRPPSSPFWRTSGEPPSLYAAAGGGPSGSSERGCSSVPGCETRPPCAADSFPAPARRRDLLPWIFSLVCLPCTKCRRCSCHGRRRRRTLFFRPPRRLFYISAPHVAPAARRRRPLRGGTRDRLRRPRGHGHRRPRGRGRLSETDAGARISGDEGPQETGLERDHVPLGARQHVRLRERPTR